MKVLIVEDETAASKNLVSILEELNPSMEVVAITESVKQTILWWEQNTPPDLIFMDIHLSDGSAFNIFNSVTIETPVIFVTAYDQYAIDAFKVNSIHYLLKPVEINELQFALDKFKKQSQKDISGFLSKLPQFFPSGKFVAKILVPLNDNLIPVAIDDIACFYTTCNHTRIYLKNGKFYPYSKTLDSIYSLLNPNEFFRANKQYIIAKSCIKNINVWPDSRLMVTLNIELPEQLFISKNRSADFKNWVVYHSQA